MIKKRVDYPITLDFNIQRRFARMFTRVTCDGGTMKYSASTRFLNLIINVILFAGFGFLGVWYGFLITPNLLAGNQPNPDIKLPETSVGLNAMLGILGIAIALLALVGFVYSLRSFFRASNDDLVRKTFSTYVAMGIVICVFLFLNAAWLYRLTSSNFGDNDLAFVIIVYVILLILALVATNVPLLHMYGEGEHTNEIMRSVTSGLLAVDASVAIVFGVLALFNLGKIGEFAYSQNVVTKAGLIALFALIAGLVILLARFSYARAERRNVVKKLNAFLFEGGLALNGLAIAGAGIIHHVEYESKFKNISFMAKVFRGEFPASVEFITMSYIVGAAILIVAGVLAYLTVFPPKVASEN